jgi:HEAT repeat protein
MYFVIHDLYSPKSADAIQYYLKRGHEAVPELTAAINSNSDGVVRAAAPILGQIGGEAALRALRNAYKYHNKSDKDSRVDNAQHDNCEAFIKAAITMANKPGEENKNNAERAHSWLNHVSKNAVWFDLRKLAAASLAGAIGSRSVAPVLDTPVH